MKKVIVLCVSVIMCVVFCACTSTPKDIAIKYMDAVSQKDYENAVQYSNLNAEVTKKLLENHDMSGYKFKDETTVDENS